MSYESDCQNGLMTFREWAAKQTDRLPDDPWKLPKDCPIWKLGLSLAQADGIFRTVRAELGEM